MTIMDVCSTIFKISAPFSDILLKQPLGGHQFYNNVEAEMAIHEWLEIQQPNFC
jgi:hypothetical protein